MPKSFLVEMLLLLLLPCVLAFAADIEEVLVFCLLFTEENEEELDVGTFFFTGPFFFSGNLKGNKVVAWPLLADIGTPVFHQRRLFWARKARQ